MSEIITNIMPKSITYTKSWHSFSDPNSQIQKLLFELKITTNNTTKIFRNLESDNHSSLIILKDQIKFSDIQKFTICVSKLPFEIKSIYELEGIINHNQSFYTEKNDNLYVEFSQNSNGFTICNCSFLKNL